MIKTTGAQSDSKLTFQGNFMHILRKIALRRKLLPLQINSTENTETRLELTDFKLYSKLNDYDSRTQLSKIWK